MTHSAAFRAQALTTDELDRVAGGIIIVSGLQRQFQLVHQTSAFDRVAINPQPLPPRIFSIGH
jgi:hypothetical protein